jgi:hypothetical protein
LGLLVLARAIEPLLQRARPIARDGVVACPPRDLVETGGDSANAAKQERLERIDRTGGCRRHAAARLVQRALRAEPVARGRLLEPAHDVRAPY